MKTVCFIVGIWIMQAAVAQNNNLSAPGGIYLNWESYLRGELSYNHQQDSATGGIKLNHFFSRDYIEVSNGKEKLRLKKDSIFGYRDGKQNVYRFYKSNDGEYRIAENKAIVIYTYDVAVIPPSSKTARLVPLYFFSTSLHSDIYPLTARNLKKAFPGNLKLHDLLDTEFDGSQDISAFDFSHGMFKVNFLLSQLNINN